MSDPSPAGVDTAVRGFGRALIVTATGLQVAWLGAVLWSRAAPDPRVPVWLLGYSLAAGALCWYVPARAAGAVARAAQRLLDRERVFVVLVSLAAAAGGAIYAASDNRTFADEREVIAVARFVDDAGVWAFFNNYATFHWLGTRHPPLMLLVYGAAHRLFGDGLYGLRLVNVLCGAGTAGLTYLLGRTVYDRATGALAVAALLAMPYFFRLSGVAMLDMPLTSRSRLRSFFWPASRSVRRSTTGHPAVSCSAPCSAAACS